VNDCKPLYGGPALAALLHDIGAAIPDVERDRVVLTAVTVYARGEPKDLRAARALLPKLTTARYRTLGRVLHIMLATTFLASDALSIVHLSSALNLSVFTSFALTLGSLCAEQPRDAFNHARRQGRVNNFLRDLYHRIADPC